METKNKLSITGIIIQDDESGIFSGYFAEIPEAVAQGNTEEELRDNLISALQNVLEYKKEFGETPTSNNYRMESFDLSVA